MKKNIKRLLFLAIFLAVLIIPYFVFAQTLGSSDPSKNMQSVATVGGYAQANRTTISYLAGKIIAVVLSLLGVIFLSLIVYGGILWMTAQGNDDQVDKAKNIIKNSVIGLIVVMGSTAIFLVIQSVIKAGLT
jgi:cytochrome bd-type quinol oxidase subunit 2